MIIIKNKDEIIKMREACAVAAEVLQRMVEHTKAGITTYDLDCFGRDVMMELGARSACYNYPGAYSPYPAHSCISINDEVVHGIPSRNVILKDGDVVSIDVAIFYHGFVGDNTRTIVIGDAPENVKKFVSVTNDALKAGIDNALPGNRIGDISHAIEKVANRNNYGILRDYVGHGVGRDMHEDPQVPNYGRPKTGPVLRPGMTLALEPMFTLGNEKVFVDKDGWTVRTVDKKVAAHFEHTILITDSLPEILTLVKK